MDDGRSAVAGMTEGIAQTAIRQGGRLGVGSRLDHHGEVGRTRFDGECAGR